jgi:hypothetical protein
MQPGDFRWAILGEYNPATSRTYGKLIGFEEERVYSENVGLRGHITFDPLIGLADLLDQNKLNAGDNVLLFICGPVSCGAIACCAV